MDDIDPWYINNLVCPVEHTRLRYDKGRLISVEGRSYPVVDGMPVMLVPDAEQTIGVAESSLDLATGRLASCDQRSPHFYLESIGISDNERDQLVKLSKDKKTALDPVALMLIAATCGNAYKHLIASRSLDHYPIPMLDLDGCEGGTELIDIGCSWGRWSIAAAQKGFRVTGIDPSLGAVLAARRIATQLGLEIKYLVGDARNLPFRNESFGCVYSYSVLQHFAKRDARTALMESERVLRRNGFAKIQMANSWGVRSIQVQARRGFRPASKFEVRYWSPAELKSVFSGIFGQTRIVADCYFGLGWQWSDFDIVEVRHKPVLVLSESAKKLSEIIPPFRLFADSVFCSSVKR